MVSIAVLGFGTVGSGVVEVLDNNRHHIAKNLREEINVKYILDVRDIEDTKYKDLQIKDFSVIESDPEIRVVVECIGGTGIALDFVRRSLKAGKSVVTSNKALVAEHGYELLRLAEDKNLNFLFEASVGGGIPVIRPINQCLAANEIDDITGILNGTTNYILTLMIKKGISFDEALKNAMDNGYSELDPTDDIEGIDACRKICILAALAFGKHVYPNQVDAEGITAIMLEDVEKAGRMGYSVKLLGRAIRLSDGRICAYVAPHLVNASHPLSSVEDVFNGISVKGNASGEVMFYGKGAGKLPTASAVVADVIDCVKHFHARKYLSWQDGEEGYVVHPEVLKMRWYVRAKASATEIRSRFGDVELLEGGGETSFIMPETAGTTHSGELKAKLEGLTVMSHIRVLSE